MPPTPRKHGKKPRHNPLHLEILKDETVEKYGQVSQPGRRKKRKGKGKDKDSEDEADRMFDVKTSKKILDLAKLQQEVIEREGDSDSDDLEGSESQIDSESDDSEGEGEDDEDMSNGTEEEEGSGASGSSSDGDDDEVEASGVEIFTPFKRSLPKIQAEQEIAKQEQLRAIASAIRTKPPIHDEDDEDEDTPEAFADGEYEEEFQIDAEDMRALDSLLPPDTGARKTLADMIFEQFESGDIEPGKKIKVVAKDDGPPDPKAGLDPKVVAVYLKVGELMNRYRSGPLPKPFKILPALPSWARLLAITNPSMWTPHAFNAATRILVSNLTPEQARVYLEMVLLPSVQENMRANQGKLNVQLYQAVLKSVYKPAAFFKGFLFPLTEGGCSLKEAAIIASIMSKVSIPILHSAAALLRLADMDYSGPVSLFIRVLLDKKYALPYKVVDGMVFHFIRLANTYKGSRAAGRDLPVLWHQSLLVFVQRYASDLTPEQKDALLDVVKARPHPKMAPEIRRQLVNAVARGEPRIAPDGDVIMA
ncbi:snoRNA-binding rRNA-processing protein [Tulasnella sp. 330]|nr:snoRNA-binding rRNA-processing protein [Tulasnella sp. 330]KAG8887014.1 snoRNA-binding rRNA-processing protein [Tulasnella sp. 332]